MGNIHIYIFNMYYEIISELCYCDFILPRKAIPMKYYSFILRLFYSQEKYRNYDIRQFSAMRIRFVLQNDWLNMHINIL